MESVRERILARLFEIIGAVDDIAASERNKPDVKGLARPAATLQDGAEEFVDKPPSQARVRRSRLEMRPSITVLIAASDNAGTLLNAFLARIQVAVLNDAPLSELIGDGNLQYQSCELREPGPGDREARMTITFAITYVLNGNSP